jgi:hypothetical protein
MSFDDFAITVPHPPCSLGLYNTTFLQKPFTAEQLLEAVRD